MPNQIIFNLTLKIEKSITQEWLNKMQNNYLPPCTDGSIILSSQINKIYSKGAEDTEDTDHTFAIQFTYSNADVFKRYKLRTMQKFLSLLDADYRGQYVYFTTEMEKIYHNSKIN